MTRARTAIAQLALPLALGLCMGAGTARAEAPADDASARIEALEQRVEELEQERAAAGGLLAGWAERVALSGSANAGYYAGDWNSAWHDTGFQVWDARFFVDAELGGPVELFDARIVRNVGFSFEWNLVRLGRLANDVGDLYVELQGIADSSWLNLQLGRFQIPVGEAYLRYGRGYWRKPFISSPVSGAWFWDEGLKLYGGDEGGLLYYVFSLAQNESLFNTSLSPELQYTLKLGTRPLDWLELSVSGLYGGRVETVPGSFVTGSALWLGEMWARPWGRGATAPSWSGGVQLPAPGPQDILRSWLVCADLVLDWEAKAEAWLSYGVHEIDYGNAVYDRRLHAWIAELVLHGELAHAALSPLYLGVRGSGLVSFDPAQGYLLDFRYGAVGYNMRSLTDVSVVLGWRMLEWVTLRTEYTRRMITPVPGVDLAVLAASSDMDLWAIELGVHF